METDEHNIEALLDFSKQQDELIEGHQKEMQQVLAGKEQLRIALAREHTLTKEQAEEIAALKEQVAKLQAENEQLRSRPNIITDQYIETQNVSTQYQFPKTYRSSRRKLNTTDQTQLPLWNNNATYM